MYIVLNTNKIEERIKELNGKVDYYEAMPSYERTNASDQLKWESEFAIEILQELLKESIDAEEVFNAARECSKECNGDGEYNILSYCGDEPVAKYTNWEEYTKTLNI